MQVETWLYRRLGRPPIKIQGDVVNDILDESVSIDSIHEVSSVDQGSETRIDAPHHGKRPAIMLRGACELMAVGRCSRNSLNTSWGNTRSTATRMEIRLEHSIMLRHALCGLSPESTQAALRLGFRPEDFKTQLFDNRDKS